MRLACVCLLAVIAGCGGDNPGERLKPGSYALIVGNAGKEVATSPVGSDRREPEPPTYFARSGERVRIVDDGSKNNALDRPVLFYVLEGEQKGYTRMLPRRLLIPSP